MGKSLLDCTEYEKDLGIYINRTHNFTEHTDYLYSRANQRLGLLKRSCHFVDSTPERRILHLTMVISIFEHCPVVWCLLALISHLTEQSVNLKVSRNVLLNGQKQLSISYSSNKQYSELFLSLRKFLAILGPYKVVPPFLKEVPRSPSLFLGRSSMQGTSSHLGSSSPSFPSFP